MRSSGEIQSAVAFDFHETAFAVPLTAFAIYFMDGRRWPSYFACIALLLLVKEDTGILVAFFGLCLLIQKQPRPGIASVLAGTIWFILVIEVFIPSCDPPDSEFGYWAYYGQFGTDFTGIVKNMLRDPLAVLQALVDPRQKLQTLFATFGPFALLAFLSPLVVLTIPIFLERFLASNSLMWGQQFHYTATLSPIIAMASADSLHRLAWMGGAGEGPVRRGRSQRPGPGAERGTPPAVSAFVAGQTRLLPPGRLLRQRPRGPPVHTPGRLGSSAGWDNPAPVSERGDIPAQGRPAGDRLRDRLRKHLALAQ